MSPRSRAWGNELGPAPWAPAQRGSYLGVSTSKGDTEGDLFPRAGAAFPIGWKPFLLGTAFSPYSQNEYATSRTLMKAKSKRIEARVKPDTLVLVQRAAELQGSSVSEFVVAAAEKAARRALDEASTVRLSAEDQRRFVELLLNPPKPTPALERARAAHEALIGPV